MGDLRVSIWLAIVKNLALNVFLPFTLINRCIWAVYGAKCNLWAFSTTWYTQSMQWIQSDHNIVGWGAFRWADGTWNQSNCKATPYSDRREALDGCLTSMCGLMTVEQILPSKPAEQKPRARDVHEVQSNFLLRILVTRLSKEPVALMQTHVFLWVQVHQNVSRNLNENTD